MKKFKYLVKYGLKKRVWRKAFLISNIVIALLLIGIINIPSIVSLFSNSSEDQIVHINVINETSETTLVSDLSTRLNEPFGGTNPYEVTSIDKSSFDETVFWQNDQVDITIDFSGTISNPVIEIYNKKPSEYNYLANQINLQLISYQITDYQPANISQVFAPNYEDPNQQAEISSMSSMLVLPMFILIIMATQFVGVDIIEEKSTKAIETIIASVPAKIHFLSKITSSIIFVVIQGILTIGYAGIASLIGKLGSQSSAITLPVGTTSLLSYLSEMIPNWPVVLLMSLLFMIAGTMFYLIIAALFASMAVTQEDYQQFQTPLMLMLLAAFYTGIFAPLAGGYTFIKVMAFIPFFTPILAPIAFASGVFTIWQALIAFFGVTVFLIAGMYLVSPVYRVAILSYDQTKFGARVKNYFKKAFPTNGNDAKSI